MDSGETLIRLPCEGATAFVAVDSQIEGQSMGGLRVGRRVTAEQIAGLARKMTQKLALARMPIGGAKAGIFTDLPPGPERDKQLECFGEKVASYLEEGLYLGTDQGVTYRDRELLFRAAGYEVSRARRATRLPCTWATLWSHCYSATGFGVVQALLEYIDLAKPSCRGTPVTVHGFGTVGRAVAELLGGRGYPIVAVADCLGTVYAEKGLPVRELIECTDDSGTIDRARIPAGVTQLGASDGWLDVGSPILVLAATDGVVTEDNAHRLSASVVLEGANGPCTPGALAELTARGVTVLPDVAINGGGALVTGLVLTGLAPKLDSIDSLVAWIYSDVARRIRRNVDRLAEAAAREERPMWELAPELAARERSASDAWGRERALEIV